MIHNVLTSIGGIGLYGLISLCLFFSVFVGTLIWVLSLKKPYLNAMRALPLHDEARENSPNDSGSNATPHIESRHE